MLQKTIKETLDFQSRSTMLQHISMKHLWWDDNTLKYILKRKRHQLSKQKVTSSSSSWVLTVHEEPMRARQFFPQSLWVKQAGPVGLHIWENFTVTKINTGAVRRVSTLQDGCLWMLFLSSSRDPTRESRKKSPKFTKHYRLSYYSQVTLIERLDL